MPEAMFCSCGSEAVVIALDDGEVSLAVFAWRGSGGVEWRSRLRQIWRVLTVGYPYEDDIILSRADAERLGQKLVEFSTGGEARP